MWVPIAVVHRTVERTTHRYRLYVRTPDDARMRALLERNASEPLRWLEFSSDAHRNGLLLSFSLFVVAVDG